MHNITKDFISVLNHWQTFFHQLKHVVRLLSKRRTKQRLLITCVSLPPYNAHQHEIKDFRHSVHEERWGIAMAAITSLLPLKNLLRHAWNLQAYHAGGSVEAANVPEEHTVQVDTADTAITSISSWFT